MILIFVVLFITIILLYFINNLLNNDNNTFLPIIDNNVNLVQDQKITKEPLIEVLNDKIGLFKKMSVEQKNIDRMLVKKNMYYSELLVDVENLKEDIRKIKQLLHNNI